MTKYGLRIDATDAVSCYHDERIASTYFKDGKFKYNKIIDTFPDEHDGEWQQGEEVTRL